MLLLRRILQNSTLRSVSCLIIPVPSYFDKLIFFREALPEIREALPQIWRSASRNFAKRSVKFHEVLREFREAHLEISRSAS
eukprot:UN00202